MKQIKTILILIIIFMVILMMADILISGGIGGGIIPSDSNPKSLTEVLSKLPEYFIVATIIAIIVYFMDRKENK